MLRLFTLLVLLSSLAACNAHEKAVKMISKKAKEKAHLLVSPAQVCIETQINNLECLICPPSLSESIVEKTELISSW